MGSKSDLTIPGRQKETKLPPPAPQKSIRYFLYAIGEQMGFRVCNYVQCNLANPCWAPALCQALCQEWNEKRRRVRRGPAISIAGSCELPGCFLCGVGGCLWEVRSVRDRRLGLGEVGWLALAILHPKVVGVTLGALAHCWANWGAL